jgi:hypothetical protein
LKASDFSGAFLFSAIPHQLLIFVLAVTSNFLLLHLADHLLDLSVRNKPLILGNDPSKEINQGSLPSEISDARINSFLFQ